MTQPSSDPVETGLPRAVTRPLLMSGAFVLLFGAGLAVWSTQAQLATTIRANGTLISSRPNFEVQHPFGGPIDAVLVTAQDNVQKGQQLFVLETKSQRKALREVAAQIQTLTDENSLINSILNTTSTPEQAQPVLARQYAQMQDQRDTQISQKRASSEADMARADAVRDEIELLKQRKEILVARMARQEALTQKGLVTQADQDALTDQILDVEGQLKDRHSLWLSLRNQSQQAQIEMQNLHAEFELSLLAKLVENEKRLPELRRQRNRIEEEIEAAIITAPIDGAVVSIQYDSARMFAPKGETLITLSQSLDQPKVKVEIPTTAIDQVTIGMEGLLTIPSLPQREMPKINVQLTAVSPEATKDPDGNPVSYTAQARINADDLSAAKAAFQDRLQLATDMPVSVALSGRETTFAEYLIGPFLQIFQGALQD